MQQRILGATLLAICIGLIAIAWGYQTAYAYEPVGPRAYPLLLLTLISAGALYLLLKSPTVNPTATSSHEEEKPLDRLILTKVSLCIGLLLMYAVLFERLGFLISTLLFGFFIALLYGAHWTRCIFIGVVASISLYLLFDYALDVPLPLGILELLED